MLQIMKRRKNAYDRPVAQMSRLHAGFASENKLIVACFTVIVSCTMLNIALAVNVHCTCVSPAIQARD